MKVSAATTTAQKADTRPVEEATAPARSTTGKPQAKAMPTRKAASVSEPVEQVEVTAETTQVEVAVEVVEVQAEVEVEAEAEAEVEAAPTKHEGPHDRRPPPRVPSPPQNYEEGDHVVYPTHGVGKVERIVTEEIAGHRLELIHITFEENRMTLRVPVAKAQSAGLRKLASRTLFDEALKVLKGKAKIKRTMWSRRAQEYEAKINSGDPLAIAEVVRDLHRNAGQPDQSFSERQIYEAAMDRLAAELAALDKTDKLAASVKLTEFLKTV